MKRTISMAGRMFHETRMDTKRGFLDHETNRVDLLSLNETVSTFGVRAQVHDAGSASTCEHKALLCACASSRFL